MHRSALTVSSVNSPIIVRLKWSGTEYTGNLISVDSYMNIQLSETEEWQNGKNNGTLGQVLIRYAQYMQTAQSLPEHCVQAPEPRDEDTV